MRKNFKRLLGVLTASALVITSMCGINLINSSAENAGSEEAVNLVSDDVNNFVEFANPDSGHGPWDVPADYQKIEGAANKVWYAWHNNSSGGGLIASDDEVKYNNYKTIKYKGVSANDGALAYFYLKLEPGNYSLSFWYKGENLSSASVYYSVKQSTLEESKDLSFYGDSKFNNLAPQAEVLNKTKLLEDGSADWTEVKQNFTVSGDGTQAVRFWFGPSGGADCMWLGNIAVSVAEPEKDDEPVDPDELISKEVNKIEYFYNPDKGGASTADPSKTHMTVAEALNKNWYMWMRNTNLGHDISVVDEGHDGKPALKLTGIDDQNVYGAGFARFTLKLDPGTYEFKYWTKCKEIYGNENPAVSCTAEIYSVEAGQLDKQWPVNVRTTKSTLVPVYETVPYYLEEARYSTDWTQKNRTINVTGSEPMLVNILLHTDNVAGEVWFSDFSLKLKTAGGNSGNIDDVGDIDITDPIDPYDIYDNGSSANDLSSSIDEDLPSTGEDSVCTEAFALLTAAGFVFTLTLRKLKLTGKR